MSYRILIADDHGVSRRLVRAVLRAEGYEVECAADGAEAWAVLDGPNPPELVILDWTMPGFDGPDICRKVRARTGAPYTYLILLSAKHEREDVARGLQAGADDYVTKPFHGPELIARVSAGVRILELQRELRNAQVLLREQALRDPLTGLWNRRAILELLDGTLARAARSGTAVGVAIVDVDHFKRVNDGRGHGFGDQVLRELSLTMGSAIRASDAVGRYGGEEFLVIFDCRSVADATVAAERVRRAVADRRIDSGTTGDISVSVGVAAVMGGMIDPTLLIDAADRALYRAKRAGRDRVETESPSEAVERSIPCLLTSSSASL